MGASHQFGPFRYDAAGRVLFREGQPVALEPKVLETLQALLERRGEVVEKADLMKRVWPDCTVEDIGLSRNISILRKAIEDDRYGFIETVPKRGYRFVGAPVAGTPEAPAGNAILSPGGPSMPDAPMSARPRTPRSPIRNWTATAAGLVFLVALVYWQFYLPSPFVPALGDAAVMAVVPIESQTPDLAQSPFSEGLTSALVAELARYRGIQLISPSTVARYHNFGIPVPLMTRVLGVQVVLEGSAQTSGSQVRVSLRLSDVHSGRLIWSEVFEAADPNQGQAEVARRAASQIATALRLPRTGSKSPSQGP
ncbi:MAG: winged helix-turn-helix domain-containing protein [Bryobacterales bacterium]|nr:winged helix-turn-helix domain-containing protein [Bryobacterales bacterium]